MPLPDIIHADTAVVAVPVIDAYQAVLEIRALQDRDVCVLVLVLEITVLARRDVRELAPSPVPVKRRVDKLKLYFTSL